MAISDKSLAKMDISVIKNYILQDAYEYVLYIIYH